MRFNYLTFLGFVLLISCQTNSQSSENIIPRNPKSHILQGKNTIGIYDFEQFQHFLNAKNDTTYVINLWATWCSPCVKELPAFEALQKKYADKKVRLILVSMDFIDKLEDKLVPFLNEKNYSSAIELLVLDMDNSQDWIEQLDPTWEGTIPATIIYNNKKRQFYEQSFTHKELETAFLDVYETTLN
ncbi:MAG: TlpA family protein disulfide reductase [Saprospiraceae bacterium]|nr:TlpA family protein disulfide reductase [Saprospiraceae bacterium]